MRLRVSPTGTGSRGQVPFIMRWSVIFSTSYAGSCLRGGREKEVFFEGGGRQSWAQSRLQRGDGGEVWGGWIRTQGATVSEFKCEHNRWCHSPPQPHLESWDEQHSWERETDTKSHRVLQFCITDSFRRDLLVIFFFFFFFCGVSKWWLISVFYLCAEWSQRQTRAPLVQMKKEF